MKMEMKMNQWRPLPLLPQLPLRPRLRPRVQAKAKRRARAKRRRRKHRMKTMQMMIMKQGTAKRAKKAKKARKAKWKMDESACIQRLIDWCSCCAAVLIDSHMLLYLNLQLVELKKIRDENPHEKSLVFTQFNDTMSYIMKRLNEVQ